MQYITGTRYHRVAISFQRISNGLFLCLCRFPQWQLSKVGWFTAEAPRPVAVHQPTFRQSSPTDRGESWQRNKAVPSRGVTKCLEDSFSRGVGCWNKWRCGTFGSYNGLFGRVWTLRSFEDILLYKINLLVGSRTTGNYVQLSDYLLVHPESSRAMFSSQGT